VITGGVNSSAREGLTLGSLDAGALSRNAVVAATTSSSRKRRGLKV
jgi:hypothetical protein